VLLLFLLALRLVWRRSVPEEDYDMVSVWRGLGKCPVLEDPVVSVRLVSQPASVLREQSGKSIVYSVRTAGGSSYFAKIHGPGGRNRGPLEAWHEVFASQFAEALGMDNVYCNRGVRLDVDHTLRFRCPAQPQGAAACATINPSRTIIFKDDATGQQYVLAAALSVIEEWHSHADAQPVFDEETITLLRGDSGGDGVVPAHSAQKLRDASSILALDFLIENHDLQWLTTTGPRYIQIDKGRAWRGLMDQGMCHQLLGKSTPEEGDKAVSLMMSRKFDQFGVQIQIPERAAGSLFVGRSGAVCAFPRVLAFKLSTASGVAGIMQELSVSMQADILLSLPVQQHMVEHARPGSYWWHEARLSQTGKHTGLFERCIETQLMLAASAIEGCRSKGTLILV
jgi:hypothetical protein